MEVFVLVFLLTQITLLSTSLTKVTIGVPPQLSLELPPAKFAGGT